MTDALGADYSHFQGSPDLAGSGDFVFLKATQGTTFQDPTFPGRWKTLADLGKVRGAYHFGEGKAGSGAAQADYFLSYAKLAAGDIAILDFEWSTQPGGTNMEDDQAADFLDVVRKESTAQVIYTGPQFEPSHFVSPTVAATPLWCWVFTPPGIVLPMPWNVHTFRQDHSGQPKGDSFNGDRAALLAFASGGSDDEMDWTDDMKEAQAYEWGRKQARDNKARPVASPNMGGGSFTGAAQNGWDSETEQMAIKAAIDAGAGGTVDISAIAKAVADEIAGRMQA